MKKKKTLKQVNEWWNWWDKVQNLISPYSYRKYIVSEVIACIYSRIKFTPVNCEYAWVARITATSKQNE